MIIVRKKYLHQKEVNDAVRMRVERIQLLYRLRVAYRRNFCNLENELVIFADKKVRLS